MKKKLNLMILMSFLVFGFVSAGFHGSVLAANELKIGFLAPLSGPVAFAGKVMLNASQFAADEINAAGGVTVAGENYQIKVISYDSKYKSSPARAAAERLVFEDKVKFIIGATSLDTMAFQSVTEANKVIILPVGGAIMASPKHPYTFRITSLVDAKYVGIYSYLKDKMPGLKNVAFVNPDSPVGEGYSKMARSAAEPLGFNMVASEFIATGTSDFIPVITKILTKKPDIIDLGGTGGGSDSALIIKQARELGFKGLMVCAVGLQGKAVLQVAGAQAMEGNIETGFSVDDPAVNDKYRRFAKAFIARYPKLPFIDLTSETYDSVYYFFRFLDGQDTLDASVLKDRYADYTWDGIFGKTYYGGQKTYGIKRQVVHPAYLSQWKSGKPVIIDIVPALVP